MLALRVGPALALMHWHERGRVHAAATPLAGNKFIRFTHSLVSCAPPPVLWHVGTAVARHCMPLVCHVHRTAWTATAASLLAFHVRTPRKRRFSDGVPLDAVVLVRITDGKKHHK